jgi:DNA gyrase subunit B
MVKDPAIKTVRISKEFNDGDFIDIAVTYSADDITDFTNYESYCNWVHTIDDGEHVKAFKYGWCQAVSKIVNSSLTESEKKKNFQVSFEDCRQGLCAVINLICLFPQFTGQTKQQVGNDELFKPLSRLITKEVTEYFKKNQADCKKLISTVKGNAKARLEMKKHKHLEVKSITSLDTVDLKGFYACESKFAPECEIFITEGDSAGGQVVARRNPRYQAVFTSKGNPLNAYGLTIPKILENDEMRKFY